MSSPLVTIVTPSFNQARYLPLCLESVAAQTYPSELIEHIVMDGGSRDGSVEIVRSHEHRLAHWESGPDGGQSAAINRGMRMARGEVVAWLNSDDLYLPSAVEESVRLLEDSGADVVFGDAMHWDTRARRLYDARGIPVSQRLLGHAGNVVAQPTAFFRRRAWEKIGGLDGSLHRYLDFDLHMRLLAVGAPYRYAPGLRALIIWHGDNKCATGGWDAELERVRARHSVSFEPRSVRSRVGVLGSHIVSGHVRWLARLAWQRALRARRASGLGAELDEGEAERAIGARLLQRLRASSAP